MLEKLHIREKSSRDEYKYTEYRPDGKGERFTSQMLKEMNVAQLLKELKELCKTKD